MKICHSSINQGNKKKMLVVGVNSFRSELQKLLITNLGGNQTAY